MNNIDSHDDGDDWDDIDASDGTEDGGTAPDSDWDANEDRPAEETPGVC